MYTKKGGYIMFMQILLDFDRWELEECAGYTREKADLICFLFPLNVCFAEMNHIFPVFY